MMFNTHEVQGLDLAIVPLCDAREEPVEDASFPANSRYSSKSLDRRPAVATPIPAGISTNLEYIR